MKSRTAYKLFKKRKDGSLGPLFINSSQRIPIGKWLPAEDHPTPGFAHRPGWHCATKPKAPHLKLQPKGLPRRVWCKVLISGKISEFKRPATQGSTWLLATKMKVIKEIS